MDNHQFDKEEVFRNSLTGKKIPILTLDTKWHQLFVRAEKNEEVKALEKELNDCLKRQGKVNTETKQLGVIKKRLMSEIVEIRDNLDHEGESKNAEKDLEEHTKLINECNDKLREYEDEQLEIPRKIHEVNSKLMYETMKCCYTWLDENTSEIDEIAEWITNIRIELKKNILRKQEKELKNQIMYSYMHDIFGAEVMDIFDMRYDPMEKKNNEAASELKGNEKG